MEKKVVFVSLPMNGLQDQEIEEQLRLARDEYRRRFCLGEDDVFFVDNHKPILNFDNSFLKPNESVHYLGRALRRMASSDEVFFYGNWREARGCQIEHDVCDKYGLKYTEV